MFEIGRPFLRIADADHYSRNHILDMIIPQKRSLVKCASEILGPAHLSEMWAILAKVRVNSAILTRVSPYRTPRFNLLQRNLRKDPSKCACPARYAFRRDTMESTDKRPLGQVRDARDSNATSASTTSTTTRRRWCDFPTAGFINVGNWARVLFRAVASQSPTYWGEEYHRLCANRRHGHYGSEWPRAGRPGLSRACAA
jgi:hypothetical protein